MKHLNARSVSALVAGLGLIVVTAAAAPNAGGPLYNPSTEVHFSAVITGVRQVPDGVLPGVHLTAQAKTGVVDVYLGPADFLKIFKTNFPVGASIQVIGSRVSVGASDTLLAREVTEGSTTITLRDFGGAPEWEHWGAAVDPAIVTGG